MIMQGWDHGYNIVSSAVNFFRCGLQGKPTTMGGSEGRDTATATGAFHVMKVAISSHHFQKTVRPINNCPKSPFAKNPPKSPFVRGTFQQSKDTTVAIQGFGNAGAELAQL